MRDHLITDLAKATAKAAAKSPDRAGQVRRSTGTLLTWDAAELRGSVSWNGTVIHDCPILGAIDAFSWATGDEVVVDTIPGSGGFSSPMILGRVFRPGAANATKVLQTLQNQLAKQIAREIIAEVIQSVEAPDEEITGDTSAAFVDLDGGPVAENVQIGPSGRALAIVSAGLLAAPTGLDGTVTCWMSYAVSGATTVAASTSTSLELRFRRGDGSVSFHPASRISASRVSLVDGLNEGDHTFTAKYRVDAGGVDEGSFFARNLTVIPF